MIIVMYLLDILLGTAHVRRANIVNSQSPTSCIAGPWMFHPSNVSKSLDVSSSATNFIASNSSAFSTGPSDVMMT